MKMIRHKVPNVIAPVLLGELNDAERILLGFQLLSSANVFVRDIGCGYTTQSPGELMNMTREYADIWVSTPAEEEGVQEGDWVGLEETGNAETLPRRALTSMYVALTTLGHTITGGVDKEEVQEQEYVPPGNTLPVAEWIRRFGAARTPLEAEWRTAAGSNLAFDAPHHAVVPADPPEQVVPTIRNPAFRTTTPRAEHEENDVGGGGTW